MEDSAGEVFSDAAPLFEEEWDVGCSALGVERFDPVGVHESGFGPGLATDDDPIDVLERQACGIG